MFRKAHHVGIMVSDIERSIRWYSEVLGLPLIRRTRLNERVELAFIGLGDLQLELIHRQGEYGAAAEGIVNHLALDVDDIEAALAHLRKHGVKLVHEQPVPLTGLNGWMAFFLGPDGESFELWEEGKR